MEEFARELLFLLDTVNDVSYLQCVPADKQILEAPRLTAMEQVRSYVNPWRRRHQKQNFIYKQFRE